MIIDLPVLESIKDSQMQHGLKYENYFRYRSYCSRRLHRLRRSLNVHQGIPSSAKARHQRGRKLMDISNAMVLEAGEKNQEYGERILLIPLLLAERAWAYAMQLKQEVSEHPRRRFHLVRRLKKASEHAQRFEKLCNDPESPCSARCKEEAVAYCAYVMGLYLIEREDWTGAKDNLTKSLAIYLKMSISVKNDTVLEGYRQRIEELRASLRYCAFNLGGQGSDASKDRVQLPSKLVFHDLAFRHAIRIEEEASAAAAAEAAKKIQPGSGSPKKMEVEEETKKSPRQEEEDEDEEHFEETREGGDEYVSDEDEEEESDDDRNKQSGSRAGGVTGLVKGWLGGWS